MNATSPVFLCKINISFINVTLTLSVQTQRARTLVAAMRDFQEMVLVVLVSKDSAYDLNDIIEITIVMIITILNSYTFIE